MDILRVLNREESRIVRQQAELSSRLKRVSQAIEALNPAKRRTFRFSAASRQRMSLAQRKRWAQRRKAA